jgi:apolipoprotein N-acyltransferase
MQAWLWALVLLLAGVAQGVALAWPIHGVPFLPYGQPVAWLQWLALCVWVMAVHAAPTAKAAGMRSWLFATSWLCATFWWLTLSMTLFGNMPMVWAALGVCVLAASLGLYYALAGALAWRWRAAGPWVQAAVVGAAWVLAEWARGRLLTGFPWGAVGYAHVDAWGLLAPWVGVYGLSGLSAALAAWAVTRWWTGRVGSAASVARRRARERRVWGAWPAWLLLPWMVWPAGSAGLMSLLPSFTQSTGGMPVLLLQGNVNQLDKFDPETGLRQALDWYGDAMVQGVEQLKRHEGVSLIVAPETAVPVLPGEVDAAWWMSLEKTIAGGRSALMMGLPMGSWTEGYTNSVMAWSPGGQSYRYDKHHLVPFGEFVPPGFRWFVDAMGIPMTDFQRGALGAKPLEWGGQRLAPHICYEDLFGEELAVLFKDPAQAPTVLVNVSNIAWFGNTVALDQHRHIARMRALELERPMIRATNTGSTAAIDHQGRVLAEAPRWQAATLEAVVDGREGLTPYARWVAAWGLWPLVVLALVLLALLWRRTR